jgi:hypothetical protein
MKSATKKQDGGSDISHYIYCLNADSRASINIATNVVSKIVRYNKLRARDSTNRASLRRLTWGAV